MRRALQLLSATALASLPVAAAASQTDPELVLRAVRFYRADQDRTRVKGLVQIPYALIRGPGGTNGTANYTVSVRVADSSGLTLYQQAWESQVRAATAAEDAFTVEIVDFTLAPGSYRLEVSVGDPAGGTKASSSLELKALSDSAHASDLLASPAIRLAAANDTVPRPGEFRTGDNLVTAAAQVVLTPLRPTVFYLLEAYSKAEQKGEITVAVRDSAGGKVVETPGRSVTVAAGGSLLKGQLDLTGLPPGDYDLISTLKLGGETVQRSASITMEQPTQALVRDSAVREAAKVTDVGYFGAMPAEGLDRAKEPLAYIAEGRELKAWDKSMSVAAKRKFLTEFWRKRDPTPNTDLNERREQFYQAIDYANQNYRERGRKGVAGWRTDRGRVYAKNGTPDDVFSRQHEGFAPPYEVWKYTRGKARYYIFADRTGFGAYQLIYSNDVSESSIPAWHEVIGQKALSDVGQFLGVDLFTVVRNEEPGVQRF